MTAGSIALNIDVAQVVYEKLESTAQIPDHAEVFSEALDEIKGVLGYEGHEEVWAAAMVMLSAAKESAFRAGWAARGQV